MWELEKAEGECWTEGVLSGRKLEVDAGRGDNTEDWRGRGMEMVVRCSAFFSCGRVREAGYGGVRGSRALMTKKSGGGTLCGREAEGGGRGAEGGFGG